jgi:DNA-binding response OmpR family regulator
MSGKSKERIILVDDDLGVLKLLQKSLEDRYDVVVAPTSYDIESLIHHFQPDLMVLDIGLPEESGRDLCRSLRRRRDFDPMVILFLSGMDEPQVAAAAIQSGADGYLTKPFDVQLLRHTIAHLIQTKRFDRQSLAAI